VCIDYRQPAGRVLFQPFILVACQVDHHPADRRSGDGDARHAEPRRYTSLSPRRFLATAVTFSGILKDINPGKQGWDYHNGKIGEEEWQAGFERARKADSRALAGHETVTVLAIILDRMYTLRNQLIHGGATWNWIPTALDNPGQ
jgi:hypothetical protein